MKEVVCKATKREGKGKKKKVKWFIKGKKGWRKTGLEKEGKKAQGEEKTEGRKSRLKEDRKRRGKEERKIKARKSQGNKLREGMKFAINFPANKNCLNAP